MGDVDQQVETQKDHDEDENGKGVDDEVESKRSGRLPTVRALTEDDDLEAFHDKVVLPLPGADVVYPEYLAGIFRDVLEAELMDGASTTTTHGDRDEETSSQNFLSELSFLNRDVF